MRSLKPSTLIPIGFIAAFAIFNIVGMIDLPIYRVSALGNGVGTLNSVAIISLLGGWICSMALPRRFLLSGVRRIKIVNSAVYHAKVANHLSYMATLVALGMVTLSVMSGASVTSFDGRFATSGSAFLALYSAIIINIYNVNIQLIARGKSSINTKFLFLITIALAIASGYRSPVVIAVACYIVSVAINSYRSGRRIKIKTRAALAIGIAGIIAFSGVYSIYRTSLAYDVRDYYYEYDTSSVPDSLLFIMDPISTMHVDQVTISRIITSTDSSGHLGGNLLLSNFLTLLPGERLAARNIIGAMTTDRVTDFGRPWSITPTIQGALYADFGVFGVIFGLFFIGFILRSISRWLESGSAVRVTVAAYIFINLLMGIHNGYPDVIFYLNIMILLACYLCGSIVAQTSGVRVSMTRR
ncbi:oligosaccharide repeat unit polymerase family protein [Stenotrophomonas geniculata]|nr:oligosaccharide repeat unit polymerase family protein [Stenotrophomonas geniculata]MCR1804829.1 oligosaccharide repeat unit polymerase family protein [Stenotrophomonas geniculata]